MTDSTFFNMNSARFMRLIGILTLCSLLLFALARCSSRFGGGDIEPAPTVAPIQAAPKIELEPVGGYAGTPIKVRGDGWIPGKMVLIVLSDEQGQSNVIVGSLANADGQFETEFNYPVNERWLEPGLQQVVAYTTDKAHEVGAEFAILPPDQAAQVQLTGTLTTTVTSLGQGDDAVKALPIQTKSATNDSSGGPSATIQPTSGNANTQVLVEGGGFPANTRVNIHMAGLVQRGGAEQRPNVYISTNTDNNGNYRLAFLMPVLWPDGKPIEAGKITVLVATDDFRFRASTIFEYVEKSSTATPTPARNASASVNPTSGSANTQVTVQGGGFPANTRVNIHLAGLAQRLSEAQRPHVYATTNTDRNGNYRLTFNMPAVWPDGKALQTGTLTILVATDDFSVRASASFAYTAPTPTSTYTATSTPTPRPTHTPTWTPSPTQTPTQTPSPTWTPANSPHAEVEPAVGSANTRVTVYGGGFPANTRVNVHLGSFDGQEGGSGEVVTYAAAVTDGIGNYTISFTMPSTWPDGSAIEPSFILVLVATEDLSKQASAIFEYKDAVALQEEYPPRIGILFDDDPRNNRRGVNPTFCSGFESDCNFGSCARNQRLLWGPYCRQHDYPYIHPGLYQITLHGTGRVRAGATDYGSTQDMFGFGVSEFNLPNSYTFCWEGRQPNGYGFETIVQSLERRAQIDRVTIEYVAEQCE